MPNVIENIELLYPKVFCGDVDVGENSDGTYTCDVVQEIRLFWGRR